MLSKWPPVTVLIYTYDRPDMIRRTLRGFKEHLRYSGKLIWRLADDGSPPGYLEGIAADFPELELQWTVTDRMGVGANINKGLRARTTKYAFASEDDWLAIRTIDLDTGVTLMEGVPEIGLLRYDVCVINLFLRGYVFGDTTPPIAYFVLDRQRSRYWYVGGHPHLVQPSFHAAYGYFLEGVRIGSVEHDYASRARQIDGPEAAILTAYVVEKRPYVHMGSGTSHKGTERDAGWLRERGECPASRR